MTETYMITNIHLMVREIPLLIILVLLVLHWIGDFALQSDSMALGKSKQWKPLLTHTSIYSLCFFWFGWLFVLITFLTHTATDYFTSRVSSKLWFLDTTTPVAVIGINNLSKTISREGWILAKLNNKRHWFFVWLGLDQLIHYFTLLFTYQYLYG